MKTKISPRNNKLGKIPNVALTPIKSCRQDVPCHKRCYALGPYKRYKDCRRAWDHNYSYYLSEPIKFFDDIINWINAKRKPVRLFRWSVGGDMVDSQYFTGIIRVASACPDTKFLVFTKKYSIVNDYVGNGGIIPDNLSIVFSSWTDLVMDNPYNFPIAWYQDGTETRIPDNAIECFGTCDHCGMCWSLKDLKHDVMFYDHD